MSITGGQWRRARADDSRALMQVIIPLQTAARPWKQSFSQNGACLTNPDARTDDSWVTAGEHLVRASRGSQRGRAAC